MPITVITGRPGHGKSLFTIDRMRKESPGLTEQGRTVYAANFQDLDYDSVGVVHLESDDVAAWDQLPTGSLIVIDEAQDFFPTRTKDQVPAYVKALERHRHAGYDFWIITQWPTQLDVHLRRLADHHIHLVRPDKKERALVVEYGTVQLAPQDEKVRKMARRRYTFDFPRDAYDLYRSAELHTVDKRAPFRRHLLWILPVVAIGALGSVVGVLKWASSSTGDEQLAQSGGSGLSMTAGAAQHMPGAPVESTWDSDRVTYLDRRRSYVEGLPFATAYYERAMEPVTYPKPRCVSVVDSGRCVCHSQQGTVMRVEVDQCRLWAAEGFFDPTLDDDDVFGPREGVQPVERPDPVVSLSEPVGSSAGRSLPYNHERIRDHKLQPLRARGGGGR